MIPCLRPRRGPLERDRRTQGPALASRNELSTFLAGVERRAFKQAVFAVRDDEAALDIVQDAMLRLAEKYGANPVDELPMLFQRILQNAIRDWFRRQKVRSTWTTLLSAFVPNRDDADDADPLDTLEAEGEPGTAAPSGPEKEVQQSQIVEIIETEISRLPARRSVKTHCSRATHTLAAALKARGIEL